MGIIEHDTILDLHEAIIAANLVDARDELLAAIDRRFVASLSRSRAPTDQILSDLQAMSAVGTLVDGTVPLAIRMVSISTFGPFQYCCAMSPTVTIATTSNTAPSSGASHLRKRREGVAIGTSIAGGMTCMVPPVKQCRLLAACALQHTACHLYPRQGTPKSRRVCG